MIELKIYVIPIAALIPLIIGTIWYNPKVLGTVWMKEAGINDETMKGANMGLIFGLSYLFACLMGFALMGLTVHELGFQSMIMNAEGWNIEGSELMNNFTTLVDTYAPKYRTFGHGALHGLMGGICIAFAVFATNSLFERKSWKYIWINSGYWLFSMTLMGGVICKFI